MDYKNLIEAMYKTYHSIIDGWLFKSAVSILVSMFTSTQFSVLSAFITLIAIDLVTKWLAISRQYLIDIGMQEEKIGLLLCVMHMKKAFNAGYINSDAMKHRFCGKFIWYLIITITAVKADIMVAGAGESKMLLTSGWVFLALTEASSILENLRDAGVKQADDLLVWMKGRIGILMDRYKQK